MSPSSRPALVARLFLGLVYFVFGLNGFLQFLPAPPLEGAAGSFVGALAASGYFFPVLKGTEVLAGALLLTNAFVPLALVVLAPITIQIALFHTFLAPALALPLLLIGAQAFLAWTHRDAFRPVLARRIETPPASARPARRPTEVATASV